MRTENTDGPTMVNLSNTDRSRILWERYNGLIVWCIEHDYDGQTYGCYGVRLDDDWIADTDHGWLLNVIDEWCAES